MEAGLQSAWQGNGVAVADYDMDGDLDLYFVSQKPNNALDARSWNRLYRNNGDRTFTDVALEAGVRGESLPNNTLRMFGNKLSASWADYDSDGDPDLFLTNVGPEILYRNNGDGTFTDVTISAGLQEPDSQASTIVHSSALWWDHDLDGDLDLYIGSWDGENRSFTNNGDGTFTNASISSGLNVNVRTWMAMSKDFDLDGRPDLYLVNDFGANFLFLQGPGGVFTDASELYRVGDEGEGMGAAFGDINNDGLFEIYITNVAIRTTLLATLYLASSSPPYQDISSDMGTALTDIGWGTEFFDADHDGDMELFVVNGALIENDTPNRLFDNQLIQTGAIGFDDVSAKAGVDGHAESRGLVVFDYDDDGDLDMVVSNWGEALYLYENVGPTQNWIKLTFTGRTNNLNGVGVRVRVQTEDGAYHRLNDGIDFLGQSIQPVHVGLGSASAVTELEVIWPNGMREIYEDIAVNQTFRITEGWGLAVGTQADIASPTTIRTQVFPNPARDVVHLSFVSKRGGEFVAEVFDTLGRRVWSGTSGYVSTHELQFDISLDSLPSGTYVYRIKRRDSAFASSGTFVLAR